MSHPTTVPRKSATAWAVGLLGAAVLLATARPMSAEDPTPKKDEEALQLSKAEQAMVDLTNAERKKQNLGPLSVDATLMTMARDHSAHMARLNMLSHELEGRSLQKRITESGYKALRYGENVAFGQRTPGEAVTGWMHSPGHKANILTPDFTQIGVGLVKAKNGRMYYTQVFGNPAPAAP